MPDNQAASASASLPDLTPSEILRLRALKEAVGGFAHEISQPLNALMIASQVLKMVVQKSTLNQTEQNFILQRLEIVTTQVRKAGSIIDVLRSFVRGTASTANNTNLRDVIDLAISLMSQQLSARGIRLVQKISEQPLSTILDRSTSECIIIAAMAYARDRVEALKKENEDTDSSSDRVLELEISVSQESPVIHIHWPMQHNESYTDVGHDKLHEACLVMANVGGKINVTPSHIALQFPAAQEGKGRGGQAKQGLPDLLK